MPFTMGDFEDLLKVLREHPDWRQRLLEVLLTEELLRLPAEFKASRQETLARFEQIEAALERLAEAQARTEQEMGRLAQAQVRTEQELDRLAAGLTELTRTMERFKATQDRFGQVVGATAEARMRPAIREWLEGQGFRLIDPLVAWSINEIAEFNGVARVEGPTGLVWVVVSAKARAKPADIKALRRLLDRP